MFRLAMTPQKLKTGRHNNELGFRFRLKRDDNLSCERSNWLSPSGQKNRCSISN
jgi:hypothetical protein